MTMYRYPFDITLTPAADDAADDPHGAPTLTTDDCLLAACLVDALGVPEPRIVLLDGRDRYGRLQPRFVFTLPAQLRPVVEAYQTLVAAGFLDLNTEVGADHINDYHDALRAAQNEQRA